MFESDDDDEKGQIVAKHASIKFANGSVLVVNKCVPSASLQHI
jgi:hypothetical protein